MCVPPPWFPVSLLLVWAVLDWVYPYHSGAALAVHPVHTAYFMARRLHRPGASTLWGAFLAIAVIASHVLPYAVIYYALVCRYYLIAALPLGAWVMKVSVSLRLLLDTVKKAGKAMADGDMGRARELVQGLVRRDVKSLPPDLVASAAIESLAESLVDGFVSPLTYFAPLGPPGALLQRIVNTLDGAVGFLDEEHAKEGRVSAYLDTVLNYVPARYTALLIALSSALVGGSARGALSCWFRYASATASKNAGHPMSAMAGALGVRLEKLGHYVIPCGRRPGAGDMLMAVRVGYVVAVAHSLITAAAASALAVLLTRTL